jgi:DNA-binding NarL/FixJ family response regulator
VCEPAQSAMPLRVGETRGTGSSLRFTCECGRQIEVLVSALTPTEAAADHPPASCAEGPAHTAHLSPIEVRVLSFVSAGYTDREIARLLGTSLDGVKHAVRKSLIHLGARNRTEAAVRALSAGLCQGRVPSSGGVW